MPSPRGPVCENRVMAVGPRDPKRARMAITDPERSRALSTIRRCGSEGLLSARETEERLEQAFRARTLGELDSVVAGLPYSAHIAAEMVLTHGIAVAATRPEAPWWKGILLWSLGVDLFWVIVWLITGGAFGWLALAIVTTTISFAFRFVARHRRHLGGGPGRRRAR